MKRYQLMQVAIYVMCGGGFLGRSFAEQPAGAYIDSSVGKRPYSVKKIEAARKALVEEVVKEGLDPNDLPVTPNFTNMGGAF
jgi:hypothetical protein